MRLDELELTGVTFEIRFGGAYLIWDHAGKIWQEASNKFLVAKAAKVEPNQQRFEFGKRFSVSLVVDRLSVLDHRPTVKRGEFYEYLDFFYREVTTTLEVSSLSRIGTRLTYAKDFANSAEASAAMIDLGLLKQPSGKLFNIDGKPHLPEYGMRWEAGALGAYIQIKAIEKKVEVDPPIGETDITAQSSSKHRLVYDVDYYTLSPTPVGTFDPKLWVDQVVHAVTRDSVVFLS
jgi:hypothetical protein